MKTDKASRKKDGDGTDSAVFQKHKEAQAQPAVRGKWTPEEFEYMIGLMEAFKAGTCKFVCWLSV